MLLCIFSCHTDHWCVFVIYFSNLKNVQMYSYHSINSINKYASKLFDTWDYTFAFTQDFVLVDCIEISRYRRKVNRTYINCPLVHTNKSLYTIVNVFILFFFSLKWRNIQAGVWDKIKRAQHFELLNFTVLTVNIRLPFSIWLNKYWNSQLIIFNPPLLYCCYCYIVLYCTFTVLDDGGGVRIEHQCMNVFRILYVFIKYNNRQKYHLQTVEDN